MVGQFPDWLTWSFWTVEKSDVFRNFSIAIAGFFGFFFLVWRARSADRAARAALAQANAASKQIDIAIEQSKVALKQSEASSQQSEAAVRQSNAAVKQAEIAQNQQILDIFHRAVSHLDSVHSEAVRAGAIYTLGRIAQDSPRDRESIKNLLSVFVRERCYLSKQELQDRLLDLIRGIKPEDAVKEIIRAHLVQSIGVKIDVQGEFHAQSEVEANQPAGTDALETGKQQVMNVFGAVPYWTQVIGRFHVSGDVQAAISVLGQRQRDYEPNNLDLAQCDLRGISFVAANFSETGLWGSDLSGASLVSTRFDHCTGVGANFSGVMSLNASFVDSDFAHSSFYGACLHGAKFDRANIVGCNFRRADLAGATFEGANVSGAVFDDAVNFDPLQLVTAISDRDVEVPENS